MIATEKRAKQIIMNSLLSAFLKGAWKGLVIIVLLTLIIKACVS